MSEGTRMRAWLQNAPWQPTPRGMMVTVQLADEFISQEFIPDGVRVDEILWAHRNPVTGLVPVRLVKKP